MRRIKWGVMGTAGIAFKQVIPAMLSAENADLYAIAGRNREKVNRFKNQFGFARAHDSLSALLADPQVEAVYVPLSNDLHKHWTLQAIAAGKPVLCEKPLAASERDAAEMFEAAERAGVVLMEAFAYLHSPVIQSIKQKLDQGAIGKPGFIETAFLTRGYAPENIRLRKETLGGSVYDLGCYNISLALLLLEEEPDWIKAFGSFNTAGVDEFSAALMIFPGGCRVSALAGMCSPQRADRFFIHGSEGTIAAPIPFNASGRLYYEIIRGNETTVVHLDVPNNYKLEIEQMGRCLLSGEPPLVSRAFSLRNARVMDRVLAQIGYDRV